ncbi:MAG: tetratricopeptide repeat protein [Alistipes sp.]|nr:tetratricopeptide repeat protein [Alistipes sp.]
MKNRIIVILAVLLCSVVPVAAAGPETASYIARGRELFELGRWSDARHEFTEARALLSTNDKRLVSEIDFYLAMCSMELGEKDAKAHLLKYLDSYSGSVYLNDVRFALAADACKRNDFAEAERYFREVNYKALPADRRAHYDVRMGYIAFLDGRYDDAATYFGRVPVASEYSDHATYYRAYIAYARGDNAAARREFRTLTSREPYSRLVPYYLLQIEFSDGNYRYVTENGDALIGHAADSRRAELERIMAESWFHLENYPRTVEYIARYARSGGEMGRSENYILGYSLYRSARYAEAAEALRKVCGADDRLTQNASYHLADCLLRSGDKRAAMQSFAMASNEAYDARIAEDALFNYGKLQYELGGGAFNGAINVLSRYIAKYPASERVPEARELLIAAYYNSHDYDAAYEAIRSQPNPDGNVRAALQKIAYFRGLQSFRNGDFDAASRNFAESAKVGVSPKYNALVLFWQGEIAYARGDYAGARRKYESYLERAPRGEREYSMAHYDLGYCAFSEGDMTAAGRSFNRFLTLYSARDDYRADALNRVGDVHYSARRFADAMSSYESAAAIGTRASDYARYQRAIVLGVQGRTADKIAALRRIVGAGGGDYADDATYELGRTYIAQEKFGDGAEVLARFVEEYPSSPYHMQALSDLGLACRNLGDERRALEYYGRVVESSPGSPQAKDAMQGIREIYVARGDVGAYFDYAEKAGVETDTSQMARDSLTFASAQTLYLSGKMPQAERALTGYAESFPKGYYMDDALFMLSDCYIRAGNDSQAIAALKRLAARGRSQYTVRALEQLAAMSYAAGDYPTAAEAYRSLSEAVTQAEAADRALEGYVRSAVRMGDDDQVVKMSDYVASVRSSGRAWRESQFARAGVLSSRGDKRSAMAIYETLSAEPATAEGAESAYRVIAEAYDAKQYDKAEKAVYALSDSGTTHSYWLAKAFLTLGDICAARGDSFQARATYQSVADGYTPADDGIVAEARDRIAALK